ncbi:hypothetical protein EGR_06559 [Echinococcus granulosus]|uniref:Uncharacterized protein n=1 Tax=Echinococcus granulosus TaxID=6210 RepID=W6UKC9_ECHGR|nr:hypothetical protein EGR_06559 [Echinococcus granulosus]EUB58572.1 hypothetical protein EGR_06559 [Echinococcus granulosus]
MFHEGTKIFDLTVYDPECSTEDNTGDRQLDTESLPYNAIKQIPGTPINRKGSFELFHGSRLLRNLKGDHLN